MEIISIHEKSFLCFPLTLTAGLLVNVGHQTFFWNRLCASSSPVARKTTAPGPGACHHQYCDSSSTWSPTWCTPDGSGLGGEEEGTWSGRCYWMGSPVHPFLPKVPILPLPDSVFLKGRSKELAFRNRVNSMHLANVLKKEEIHFGPNQYPIKLHVLGSPMS